MTFDRLQHAGGAVATTLASGISSGATSCSLNAVTGWPDGTVAPFYLVIDAGLATEEKLLATTRTSTTLNTLTRGVDGTAAAAHAAGAAVSHVFTAVEADEANQAVVQVLGGQLFTAGIFSGVTTSVGPGHSTLVVATGAPFTIGSVLVSGRYPEAHVREYLPSTLSGASFTLNVDATGPLTVVGYYVVFP